MKHTNRHRWITTTLGLAGLFIVWMAGTASAADSCKARIKAGDRSVLVSAKHTSPTLKWGVTAGAETASFANAATCISVGGGAKNCMLGAAGSLAAITPPASCTVFMNDGSAACSALIKGCVPGIRLRDASFSATDPRFEAVEALTTPNKTLRFTGVNVQVVDGSGDTGGTTNGLGNLIVGYNENTGSHSRTGSHNLVVGTEHTYTSYGGIVAGKKNTTSDRFASVTGGLLNTASGSYASVSGGYGNTASGPYASVSGGNGNLAPGRYASVSGGSLNTASGDFASISGGRGNTTSSGSNYASVSGGGNNTASGDFASVSGGRGNSAAGKSASVSGGRTNAAGGDYASVSGGKFNGASGKYASLSGGFSSAALADFASVSGGWCNIAGVPPGLPMCPGFPATGQAPSVSGGYGNIAGGAVSAISGGSSLQSVSSSEWHAGKSPGFPTGAEY